MFTCVVHPSMSKGVVILVDDWLVEEEIIMHTFLSSIDLEQ